MSNHQPQQPPKIAKRRRKQEREAPLPQYPTTAVPGSEVKLRVLRRRAKEGAQLWHPEDFDFRPWWMQVKPDEGQ